MTNFSHLSVRVYARRTVEIQSRMAKFCDLWESALKVSVGSRKIAEGEYIVNNTFTYKVSLLLLSEFEPP